MKRARVAVVGTGLIGRAHAAAAQGSPTVMLSALVDPATSAAALAAAAQVPHHRSLDEMLATDRPDAVVLATPNHLHLAQALSCIEAGLPVLLEKPVTASVAEGERLLSRVRELGARVLVGHHRAHSPIMRRACQVVESGQLGQLVAVTGSATFFKPDGYFADGPWRSQLGGGPILINMIHEVHNLRMLCGEIVAVQAFASNATRGFAVEDTVAINLRFENGALGSFMLSDSAACARSWEQTSQENPAYPSYQDEDCYVISGTRGSLSVPTMRLKSYARDEDRSWWVPFELAVADTPRDDPIRLQMEHFGAVLRGAAEPLVSVADGLRNLRVTEAVAKAAQSGQVVEIESEGR